MKAMFALDEHVTPAALRGFHFDLRMLDKDGDGNTEKVSIPDYNDETHELTLIVSTVENGHNLGRVYIHVVPPETASDWVLKLTNASKSAQRRKKREQLEQVYCGTGTPSVWAMG